MRDNLLKQKIKNGESAIGTFVKMTDPSVVEVLALAGFDFFVLDTEHVAIDREQLLGILRAAEAFNITPLVRVRENQQVEILQNLDLGYMGVQVPNVDTPEQAKRMVESVSTHRSACADCLRVYARADTAPAACRNTLIMQMHTPWLFRTARPRSA